MPLYVPIPIAVEGDLDQEVILRLFRYVGLLPGDVYGKSGKSHLKQRISGYNNSARYRPWVVLVDLETDNECAPQLLTHWLVAPARYMHFRVVVQSIESWLLADREHMSAFLGISINYLPILPDLIENPKRYLVDLARRSRRKEISFGLVPRAGSGRRVGPEYNSLLSRFVNDQENGWRPNVGLAYSDSLARCVRKLQELSIMEFPIVSA